MAKTKHHAPGTVPDCDWNELVFARLHNGETTVWNGWRRSIGTFMNPAMWTQPELWSKHMKLQPTAAWGFAGYGLIAIDMDHHCAISVNDYSVPGAIHLPMDNMTHSDGHNEAFNALLNQPQHWPFAKLKLAKEGFLQTQKKTLSFDKIIREDQTAQVRLDSLTIRRGLLKINGQNHHVFAGQFIPPNWTLTTDRGQERHVTTLKTLTTLHANGFTSPDWDNVRDRMTRDLEDSSDGTQRKYMASLDRMKSAWDATGFVASHNQARRGPSI